MRINNRHVSSSSSGSKSDSIYSSGVSSIASHSDTLAMYQENAKRSDDPIVQYEFCKFLFEYAETTGDISICKQYVAEAMDWLKKLSSMSAAKTTTALDIQAQAQFQLAEFFRTGTYGPKDLVQAWQLYESCAKKGHAVACYRAGLCCEDGIGRKANLGRALLFYRKSAGMIHFPSMFKLITIYVYRSKEFRVAKSSYEGFKWLKIVATHVLSNSDERDVYALAALFELGTWYAEGTPNTAQIPNFTLDNEYAVELIYEAGRRGYVPAQFKLGEIFERGLYNVREDKASAMFWFQKVLVNRESGEDGFINLDEWQQASKQQLGRIELSLRKSSGVSSKQLQQRTSRQIPSNANRVIKHLQSRKKLKRDNIPAPIITLQILRRKGHAISKLTAQTVGKFQASEVEQQKVRKVAGHMSLNVLSKEMREMVITQ